MKLQKIQPQDTFILNICNPHGMHSFLCSNPYMEITLSLYGWLLPCYSAVRLAHRFDACLLLLRQYIWPDDGNTGILLPVSMVRWQVCSSTLPATNGFSAPRTTLVFKFPVGAKLCLSSFSDPALGWLQRWGVLLLAHFLQFLLMCPASPRLQQVNCFCDWGDRWEFLLVPLLCPCHFRSMSSMSLARDSSRFRVRFLSFILWSSVSTSELVASQWNQEDLDSEEHLFWVGYISGIQIECQHQALVQSLRWGAFQVGRIPES